MLCVHVSCMRTERFEGAIPWLVQHKCSLDNANIRSDVSVQLVNVLTPPPPSSHPTPQANCQASPAASPLKGFTIPNSNKLPQTQADLAVYVSPFHRTRPISLSRLPRLPRLPPRTASIRGALHYPAVSFITVALLTPSHAAQQRCSFICCNRLSHVCCVTGEEPLDTDGTFPPAPHL